MTNPSRDRSLGDGVLFRNEDYVGIARRVLILAVDAPIVFIGGVIYGSVLSGFLGQHVWVGLLFFLQFMWTYQTALKASSIRTPGYIAADARIVTLKGERPSNLRMTFRLMMWLLGPFNILIDLMWVGLDDDRQTLRDRYSGTMVVRNSARPIGTGEIHLVRHHALAWALMFPRVMHKYSIEEESPSQDLTPT
jgi:uncharacterized RDD family membrane protein YckC